MHIFRVRVSRIHAASPFALVPDQLEYFGACQLLPLSLDDLRERRQKAWTSYAQRERAGVYTVYATEA